MAQTLFDGFTGLVRDQSGNIVPGAQVEVLLAVDPDPFSPSNTLADVFSDRAGLNAIDQILNPILSDAQGKFTFYADAGYYHVIAYNAGENYAIPDVAIGTAKSIDSDALGALAFADDISRAKGIVTISADASPVASTVVYTNELGFGIGAVAIEIPPEGISIYKEDPSAPMYNPATGQVKLTAGRLYMFLCSNKNSRGGAIAFSYEVTIEGGQAVDAFSNVSVSIGFGESQSTEDEVSYANSFQIIEPGQAGTGYQIVNYDSELSGRGAFFHVPASDEVLSGVVNIDAMSMEPDPATIGYSVVFYGCRVFSIVDLGVA